MDRDHDPTMRPSMHDVFSALRTRDFDGLALEFYIDPGDADDESITSLFVSLSKLDIAAGGLGLVFVPESGPDSSFVRIRAYPIGLEAEVDLDSEFTEDLLKKGGYESPTQALQHACAVLAALFTEQRGELYFRKDDEIVLFDPLSLQSEMKALVRAQRDESFSTPEQFGVRAPFGLSDSLQSLLRLGEFSNLDQCINTSLATLDHLLDRRNDGWEVVLKVDGEFSSISLPSP